MNPCILAFKSPFATKRKILCFLAEYHENYTIYSRLFFKPSALTTTDPGRKTCIEPTQPHQGRQELTTGTAMSQAEELPPLKHYLLTTTGDIKEFSTPEAMRVADGSRRLPEFANSDLHYVQIQVDDSDAENVQVRAAGAKISFDDSGQFTQAGELVTEKEISEFAYETCVQLALGPRYSGVGLNH